MSNFRGNFIKSLFKYRCSWGYKNGEKKILLREKLYSIEGIGNVLTGLSSIPTTTWRTILKLPCFTYFYSSLHNSYFLRTKRVHISVHFSYISHFKWMSDYHFQTEQTQLQMKSFTFIWFHHPIALACMLRMSNTVSCVNLLQIVSLLETKHALKFSNLFHLHDFSLEIAAVETLSHPKSRPLFFRPHTSLTNSPPCC